MRLFLLTFCLQLQIAIFCNETDNNKVSNHFDSQQEEKEAIKNQIKNVYLGLINGAYTSEQLSGTTPENFPFYNVELSTLTIMRPLVIEVEPKNIEILNMSENATDVKYELSISKEESTWIFKDKSTGEEMEFSEAEFDNVSRDPEFKNKYEYVDRRVKSKQVVLPISMVVKKIDGKWKLDGQRFLPNN